MKIHKLEATDAFVVFDLDDAPRSIGTTRLAPKILVDGATLLARTNTYLFASFGQQIGGASAGINAKADGRDDAVGAFVTELAPLTAAGGFVALAGKGVKPTELSALQPAAPWVPLTAEQTDTLLAAGVVESAAAVVGDLHGRTVALEGLDTAHAPLVEGFAARGARIGAAATTAGTIVVPEGIDGDALAARLRENGPKAVTELGPEVQPAGAVFGVDADVLCPGSKAGVIDDVIAGDLLARCIVPSGPVPVTAKALAALGRRGTVVLPDFVTIAGPLLAMVGAVTPDGEAVATAVRGVLAEVSDHERGPLLAACFRAEDFLRTWQPALPFGRPIA